jgi:hypothetical protein
MRPNKKVRAARMIKLATDAESIAGMSCRSIRNFGFNHWGKKPAILHIYKVDASNIILAMTCLATRIEKGNLKIKGNLKFEI